LKSPTCSGAEQDCILTRDILSPAPLVVMIGLIHVIFIVAFAAAIFVYRKLKSKITKKPKNKRRHKK
jgi:cytochrome bd-type quinol oxidase subunit 2